ncbi:MAG: LURP-one-related family protein [Anaeroplasmataceae bacterium]|nr:LURP-one-related family protein [Anaeroplasmataceae bacterium]
MKLYIKDKILSIRRNMSVLDENGKAYLYVKGKAFSPTHKRRVTDLNGNTLFYIRRKFFHFLPKAFIYDANHERIAKITRKFGLRHNFVVEGYHKALSVEGDIIAWHFSILEEGKLIGSISKRLVSLFGKDAFELEVDNQEDAAFLVAFIAAIDNIYDSK